MRPCSGWKAQEKESVCYHHKGHKKGAQRKQKEDSENVKSLQQSGGRVGGGAQKPKKKSRGQRKVLAGNASASV